MSSNGSRQSRDGLGTLGWAERTRGIITARDRIRLVGQGAVTQLVDVPRTLLARIGLRPRQLARYDADALRMPDSRAAREAEALCAQMRPEMLVNHSYRTFAFATILAAHEGIRFDEEVVYVASLLHDLGLSESHPPPARSCFTVIGASAAQRAGEAGSWDADRAHLAAEAITLHMNLRVPRDCVEARLVTAGTLLDVIGRGYWRVAPETFESVFARYPRHGVKRGMVSIFREQARAHPGTRAHFYQRYLGLPLLLRAAPFEQ